MKKILLLGGSHGQIQAIEEAKSRGFYTILCDYLPDNPGREIADEYHNISTTDMGKVLDLAMKEEIDFILAYASDPAVKTAAFVAEKMNLPCSSYRSVEVLSDKDLFRELLQEKGCNNPKFIVTDSEMDPDKIHHLNKPWVVKPVDSSDTKGVTLVKRNDHLREAVKKALLFSKRKKVIIEEYIGSEQANLHGDAFVFEGRMVFCLLGDRIFSSEANPLKPSTELYPSTISSGDLFRVETAVTDILEASGFTFGAINIEARIDKEGNVYIMEIGARSGGTLTPQTIAYTSGFDMLKATFDVFEHGSVKVEASPNNPAICFALHVNEVGIFERLELTAGLQKHVAERHLFVNRGDKVKPYSEPGSTIGVLIFRFDSMQEAGQAIETMYDDIQASIILS